MSTGRDAVRAVLADHAVSATGVLVGEAAGVAGLFGGIRGSLVLTPLSESGSVGVALGLALAGKRPVVELIDAPGLARAVEALAEALDISARSGGSFSAPIVVLAPLPLTGELPRLPVGVRRFIVGNASDFGPSVAAALKEAGPSVVLYGSGALETIGETLGGAAGEPVVVRNGTGVVILAEGDGVATSVASGGEAHIIDLRGTRNLAVLAKLIAPTGRAVFCTHESAEALLSGVNAAFWRLEAPPVFLHPAGGAAAVAAAVSQSASA